MHRLLLIPTAVEAGFLLGDALAASLAAAAGQPCAVRVGEATVYAALCGFGLAASGAGASHAAAQLTAQGGVSGLYLVGVAGTYAPGLAPVGSVVVGTATTCSGIGVGEGVAHQSAAAIGWRQAWGDGGQRAEGKGSRERTEPFEEERIELARPQMTGAVLGEILSVAAASASPDEAARRRAANPAALVEDMESFAVALAARLGSFPLTVVRGISNVAGDRDNASWRMPEALASAHRLLAGLLSQPQASVPA